MSASASDPAGRLASVPAERRQSALIRSLADLFSLVPEHLPEDIERFGALFRPLYREAVPADRLHAASVLARRHDLPAMVIADFLADEAEIVAAYLAAAPLPGEADLLEIVAHGSLEDRRMIARRPNLPETIVLALLVAGEDAVVADLADNASAEIPENLIVRLEAEAGQRATGDAAVPLTRTYNVAECDRFLALDDDGRFQYLTNFTAETAFRAVDPAVPSFRRAPSPDLFTTVVAGDRAVITADLARGLAVDPGLVRRLVDDPGGEGLAVMLAALGADNTLATSVILWLLPEESRSFWRVGLLRDLHERMGWRAGQALMDHWCPPMARPVETARRAEPGHGLPTIVQPRRRILRPAELARRA